MARLTAVLLAVIFLCVGCSSFPPPKQSPQVTDAPTEYVPEAYFAYPSKAEATATPRPTYPSLLEALVTPTPRPEPVAAAETSAPPPEPLQDGTNIRLTEVRRGEQVLYRMGDTNYLTLAPIVENSDDKKGMSNRIAQLTALAEVYPGTQFYAYFINRATTLDWYQRFNGIKAFDCAQYIADQLGAYSRIHFGEFTIADFDYYQATSYKTDFHVNYIASDRIYQDVYRMMAENMTLSSMLSPVETLTFDHLMTVGDLIEPETYDQYPLSEEELDEFKAYRYALPTYTSFVNEKPAALGLEEEYMAGEIYRDIWGAHQFAYYGGQTAGIVRLEFDRPDRPNLLMLSDSQGRPSRLPLASHFNTTLFLDYEGSLKTDLNALIEQYDIGVVLLIGQISMFEVWD